MNKEKVDFFLHSNEVNHISNEDYDKIDYILLFWLSPAPVPLYLLLVVLNLYRTVSDTLLVDSPSQTIFFIFPK